MITQFIFLFFFKNLFIKNILNDVTDDFIFNDELNVKLKHLDNHNFTKIKSESNNSLTFTNIKFRKVKINYNVVDNKTILNSIWYPQYNYECPILTLDYENYNNITTFNYNFINMYNTNYYNNTYIKPFDNVVNLKEFLILYFNMFRLKPVDRWYVQEKHRFYERNNFDDIQKIYENQLIIENKIYDE
jgi:hypothetical protein